MKHISFVILAYHPQDIDRLLQLLSVFDDSEVILVDNSTVNELSVPNTLQKSHKKLPKYTTLISHGNIGGYSGGMNAGMKKAFGSGADWVVILNDDMMIEKNALEKFTELLNTLKPSLIGTIGGYLDSWRWTTVQVSHPSEIPLGHTHYISGTCMAIHRDIFKKVGYFDERYFLYYEDADYSVRVARKGYPLKLVSIPGIIHIGSQSTKQDSALKRYYLTRNHMHFVWKLAPLRVKLYEIARWKWSCWEFLIRGDRHSLSGLFDFVLGKKGVNKHYL